MSRASIQPDASNRPTSSRIGLAIQAVLLVMGSAVALAPPASGMILVAPLPGSISPDIRWAWRAGAVPVGRGPYSGSYVVRGSLADLLLPALANGSLLFTARFANCGNTVTRDI